eukprot:s758_g26.t1
MDGEKKVEVHDPSSDSDDSEDDKKLNGDYVHFVNAFSQEPKLKEVVMATIKGSLDCENKAPQMSAYTIQSAILQFYTKHKLFPQGLSPLVPAVVDWALKHGAIIKKLDKGKPVNLAEIPNTAGSRSSTTASSDLGSSDVSSVSSTMCSKLARIASQLEALKLAKASKSVKIHETTVVDDDDPNSPDSKGRELSDQVEHENSLAKLPPRMRVAQILKNAKMRRLANDEVPTTDGDHARENTPKDDIDVPDFVCRALGDGAAPKTFPLSDQYVNTIKKAKEAMDGALSEPDSEDTHEKPKKPKKSKSKQKTTKKEGKPKGEKVESSWKYGEIRSSFIKNAKGKGMDYKTAQSLWNESREKKELLAPLSLCELKRRKFVDKTCKTNPWP